MVTMTTNIGAVRSHILYEGVILGRARSGRRLSIGGPSSTGASMRVRRTGERRMALFVIDWGRRGWRERRKDEDDGIGSHGGIGATYRPSPLSIKAVSG